MTGFSSVTCFLGSPNDVRPSCRIVRIIRDIAETVDLIAVLHAICILDLKERAEFCNIVFVEMVGQRIIATVIDEFILRFSITVLGLNYGYASDFTAPNKGF